VPTKLTTNIVDNPEESDDPCPISVLSSVTATFAGSKAEAVASTSNASTSSSLPRNQLAIQPSFFFGSVQRIFRVPASVGLSCKGFEVPFSTDSVPWNDAAVMGAPTDEQDRAFEMKCPPRHQMRRSTGISRTAHVLVWTLLQCRIARIRAKSRAMVHLETRVQVEEETTQSWLNGCVRPVLWVLLLSRGK
jgi:hypothetical protein